MARERITLAALSHAIGARNRELGRPAGAPLRPGTRWAIADLMESMEYVDGDPVATGTETDWTREWKSLDRLRSRPTTETLAAESVARAELSAWVQSHESYMPNATADVVADLDKETAP